VPIYGFLGAAWITLVTEVVVVSASALFLGRALGVRRPNLGRLGHVVLAAVCLLLVLEAVSALGAPLAVLVATACVAYPLLLFGVGALRIGDLRALARKELPA
jgi:hypothetical protein